MAIDDPFTTNNPTTPTVAPLSPSTPDPLSVSTTNSGQITDAQKNEFLEIGRISKMREEIDQGGLISKQMKKRMSVIDLIPCLFKVNYGTFLKGDFTITDKFKPIIEYKDAIDDFASTLWSYGLKEYAFLRLYLTDMTTASDDMSNEYTKNVLDSGLATLSSTGIGQALKTKYGLEQSMGLKTFSAKDFVESIASINVTKKISDTTNLLQEVLTHGARIAFPKIWSGSSYSPNLSCVVKLVSPYGHPKAINEFIIKPLSYLLILLSPTTQQGITTHRPNYLTLKSYGLSNLSLCYPKQLTIRRGGDDSSYNSFLQPMTVEVSLSFEAVTEGFACFLLPSNSPSDTQVHEDGQIFSGSEPLSIKDFSQDFDMPSSLFPTLKSLVNSFRPFGYNPTTAGTGVSTGTTGDSSISSTLQSSSATIAESAGQELGLSEQDFSALAPTTDISAISPPEGVNVKCSGE